MLTPEEKQAWDTISEESKAIILNCRFNGKLQPKYPRRRPLAPHHDTNSQDRIPGAPIEAAARIDAAEQQPTPSSPLPVEPPVDTNVRQAEVNVNEMVSNLQSALYDDDGQWGDSDNFLVHLASREVNQTIIIPVNYKLIYILCVCNGCVVTDYKVIYLCIAINTSC